MVELNPTALLVTGGLVIFGVIAMLTNNHDIAIGALAALAGWLGGNHNGRKAS